MHFVLSLCAYALPARVHLIKLNAKPLGLTSELLLEKSKIITQFFFILPVKINRKIARVVQEIFFIMLMLRVVSYTWVLVSLLFLLDFCVEVIF